MPDVQASPGAGKAALNPPITASPASRGLAAATGAFAIWGLFPLYIKGLASVPALEITAHRVAWSLVLILAWMAARRELGNLAAALTRRGVLIRLIASAILVSINWLVFVWAVNQNRVVEVSLGYYINPLMNVVLGIFVLSERLNRTQWVAVGLAAAGVAYLTIQTGALPWVALTVATSFALYGLIRKTANVDALPGLGIEMAVLTPFAVGYLIWCEANGVGALGHSGLTIDILLVASGVVTAVPLFLFSYGARRIPYSTVGVLQYLAPTLQLASGIVFFGEPFQGARVVGFVFIWVALLLYAGDGLWRVRARRA